MAYWVSRQFLNVFTNGIFLKDEGSARQGLGTSDNERFLRFWYEVSCLLIKFDCKECSDTRLCEEKWFPYIKGGTLGDGTLIKNML